MGKQKYINSHFSRNNFAIDIFVNVGYKREGISTTLYQMNEKEKKKSSPKKNKQVPVLKCQQERKKCLASIWDDKHNKFDLTNLCKNCFERSFLNAEIGNMQVIGGGGCDTMRPRADASTSVIELCLNKERWRDDSYLTAIMSGKVRKKSQVWVIKKKNTE